MGTNYYLHKNPCDKCGRCDRHDRLHIGKSSAGWCFSLHVMPDEGINTLDDWKREFATGVIVDEYDNPVDVDTMLKVITHVGWRGFDPRRHPVDGRCIGNGPGSYDYIVGYFS